MDSETKKGKIKWRPKSWRSEYDQIVALSVMNQSNIAIAERLGLTKEHVSTILNLPEAKLLYEKLKNRVRESIENNIPAQLEESAKLAAKRVQEILKDDELKQKAPFAMAHLSMDVLKGVGHLRSANAQPTQQSSFQIINNGQMAVITPQQKSDLLEGLDKVKQVAEIHVSRLKDGTNG